MNSQKSLWITSCERSARALSALTYGEVGGEGGLVGGESPDAEVVDGDDALHRKEGLLHHREAHVTRDPWNQEENNRREHAGDG